MAFEIIVSSAFKKDLKKIKKRSSEEFEMVADFILLLEEYGRQGVPSKNKPHKLIGNYEGTWEAHIKPDLLIIWFQIDKENEIKLARCGSHSDLFK